MIVVAEALLIDVNDSKLVGSNFNCREMDTTSLQDV